MNPIQANPQILRPSLPCPHMLQRIYECGRGLPPDQWFSTPTNGVPAIIENLTNQHENRIVNVGSYFSPCPHLAVPNQATHVRTFEEPVFVGIDFAEAKGDCSLSTEDHRAVLGGYYLLASIRSSMAAVRLRRWGRRGIWFSYVLTGILKHALWGLSSVDRRH